MARKNTEPTFADIVAKAKAELPGPGEEMPNPLESGELVDAEGVMWRLRRADLDRRLAVRLIKSAAEVVVGESGGLSVKWVDPATINQLWNAISPQYVDSTDESGKIGWPEKPFYVGYEFSDENGRRLLFLKEVC